MTEQIDINDKRFTKINQLLHEIALEIMTLKFIEAESIYELKYGIGLMIRNLSNNKRYEISLNISPLNELF